MKKKLISIVIPVHNEEKNVSPLIDALQEVCGGGPAPSEYLYEFIFINDGSADGTEGVLILLATKDLRIKVIEFSRNFGKELALTAGIHAAQGDAVITMDADFQQPPKLIPEFIAKWEGGAEVVIGIRKKVTRENMLRRLGGVLFYTIMNKISDVKIIPQSTDFRLLDRKVVDVFNIFKERNRLTRGLIDWLGFKREFIYFDEPPRLNGDVSYSTIKLMRLAVVSFISNSLLPLKVAGYFGSALFLVSGATGFFMIVWRLLGHPYHIFFSNTLEIGILNTFLISIVLMSLGVIALYIGNIHEEIAGRPMYVIRRTENL